MPKANYQRKPESNYQTTDPCYGHEEDSEDETQATNKFNNNIKRRQDDNDDGNGGIDRGNEDNGNN